LPVLAIGVVVALDLEDGRLETDLKRKRKVKVRLSFPVPKTEFRVDRDIFTSSKNGDPGTRLPNSS
jgi:hypothetical protein